MHLTTCLTILPLLAGAFASVPALVQRADNSTTTSTTDESCNTDMCILSSTNSTTTQYTLSYKGSDTLGWMAMGFGSQMTGTSMVIMWANSDGTYTLSQREASGHIEPSVADSPSRVATLAQDLSSTSEGDVKFAFTVDSDSTTKQSVIYAYSSIQPSSSDAGATLTQHDSHGTGSLNVAAPSSDSGDSGDDDSDSGDSDTADPLLKYQKMIVAHGIMCMLGFLVCLPVGALWARYVRTLAPKVTWLTGHWVFQFGIALPIIVSGVALGIASISEVQGPHLARTHQKWGIAIFVLYFVQLFGGSIIHVLKSPGAKNRPPQNYGHAILGIFIIAISFYQVRTGYKTEYPAYSGRGNVGRGADIMWYIWVVIVPLAYVAGLALLPKQYRMEANSRSSFKTVHSSSPS